MTAREGLPEALRRLEAVRADMSSRRVLGRNAAVSDAGLCLWLNELDLVGARIEAALTEAEGVRELEKDAAHEKLCLQNSLADLLRIIADFEAGKPMWAFTTGRITRANQDALNSAEEFNISRRGEIDRARELAALSAAGDGK